jgi:hypothetical protein
LVSILTKTGALAECIEIDMFVSTLKQGMVARKAESRV